jgi:hypothetical protein
MKVASIYSIKASDQISQPYSRAFSEVCEIINEVKASAFKIKTGGQTLYSSKQIRRTLSSQLNTHGWRTLSARCKLPASCFVEGFENRSGDFEGSREMDFVKEGVGVEIEVGKPIQEICSVCAKMTIFRNLGHIDCGIEIVPIKAFADEMSTGVSYFEQFVWDLENRGTADIDIPVLILGIDA